MLHLPEFPVRWELVTCNQVRDLLKSARSIPHVRPPLHVPGAQRRFCNGHVYAVGTVHSHLFEVPTGGPPGQICKTLILSLLCICRGNGLSYLNHIIIAYYNARYGCGKCLKQAFMLSFALHNHKNVCLKFTKKPGSGGGGDGSQGGSSTRATPKKKDSKAPTTESQGSSTPTALQMTPHHSRCDKSHHSKLHRDSRSKKDSSGNKKRKKKDVSPARKGSSHKSHKNSGRC